jgi:FecR protein
MLPLAFVLMQFVVSAKPGLVTYFDGRANVHTHEQIPAGKPIETGPNSHIEVLLNPGSFLRVAENSTVVFDSVNLTNIAVRVVSGGAFLEAADIEKRMPIRITTGGLTVSVVSPGMYRFYEDTAAVLGGKLRTADSSITVKKGQQITSNGDRYEESKIPLSARLDDFELWVGAARGAALRIEAAVRRRLAN